MGKIWQQIIVAVVGGVKVILEGIPGSLSNTPLPLRSLPSREGNPYLFIYLLIKIA